MFERASFEEERQAISGRLQANPELQRLGREFSQAAVESKYAYIWDWRGLPIIQLPADLMAIQQLIWRSRPTVIIEAGVAWGGGTAFAADMLSLVDGRLVVGVDLNLADSVETAITALDLPVEVELIRGSSTSALVVEQIVARLSPSDRVMLMLDSNHTHDHVLDELRVLTPLVTAGQYCVVMDTLVEFMPKETFPDRPWGPGNNPYSAIEVFLDESQGFVRDKDLSSQILTTLHPGGYLRAAGA